MNDDRLGPYRLLRRLGEGGMGVVHLAVDPQGRQVAVKVLRAEVAGDELARRRLSREVETMRRVRSKYIAEVLDADVTGHRPYIVTRYVAGRSLDEIVKDDGPLDLPALLKIGHGVAAALAAVHSVGVIHRDLKPGNVLILDGDPVLIDFGIAQAVDATRLTQTGMFIGTPGYLAPEIIEGQEAGPEVDIHAWAGTLLYAGTGQPPFGKGTLEMVFYNITAGKADVSAAPGPLQPLLKGAFQRNPAKRPKAAELAEQVARLMPKAGLSMPDEISTVPHPDPSVTPPYEGPTTPAPGHDRIRPQPASGPQPAFPGGSQPAFPGSGSQSAFPAAGGGSQVPQSGGPQGPSALPHGAAASGPQGPGSGAQSLLTGSQSPDSGPAAGTPGTPYGPGSGAQGPGGTPHSQPQSLLGGPPGQGPAGGPQSGPQGPAGGPHGPGSGAQGAAAGPYGQGSGAQSAAGPYGQGSGAQGAVGGSYGQGSGPQSSTSGSHGAGSGPQGLAGRPHGSGPQGPAGGPHGSQVAGGAQGGGGSREAEAGDKPSWEISTPPMTPRKLVEGQDPRVPPPAQDQRYVSLLGQGDPWPTRRVSPEELRQMQREAQQSAPWQQGPGGQGQANHHVPEADVPTRRVRPDPQDLPTRRVRPEAPDYGRGTPVQPPPYIPPQAQFPPDPQTKREPFIPGARPGQVLQRSAAYGVAGAMLLIIMIVLAARAPVLVALVSLPVAVLLRAADLAQPELITRRPTGAAALDVIRVFAYPKALVKSAAITLALIPYALILGLPVTLLLTVMAGMSPYNALAWGAGVALWTVCAGPGVEGPGRQMRRTLSSLVPSRTAAMVMAGVFAAMAALTPILATGTFGDNARRAIWTPVNVGPVVDLLQDWKGDSGG
ncbi:protein kinase domain-containing protein [Nonomuraea sp. C10]|uniref:protein kinase domain-containing protein n=1 Tax=Nonomuraea sp. C10 TaxID=2600577 RepID=UPI001C9D6250|nr:protein kinase [Nonomuraea sp. C10]